MSEKSTRHLSFDCRYFVGDRPCLWHKREGAICECEHYRPTAGEVLIIKLDAIGDVLRTTCLLPGIARTWPELRIAWITRSESAPLLRHNPYLNQVIAYGADALTYIGARRFEKVINLDAGQLSASLAAQAEAREKIGYILSPKGHVIATNTAAEEWLKLGVFDDLKRANRQTYQQRMCAILDLPESGMDYTLQLTSEEVEAGRSHLAQLGVDFHRPVLGIHTGGGTRWKLKQWHPEKFAALAQTLAPTQQIILFGGPRENKINQELAANLGDTVFDAGCDNTVRHFASLVRCCSVMVSGDSLAMHIALAVGCRAVVLFGPTSHSEIELFGRGEKVIPDLGCLVCYKTDCDFDPNCMDSISVDDVRAAVMRQLVQCQ